MNDDKKTRDNVMIPLSWLVYRGAGNGAAGRAFPTLPATSEKPQELPPAPAKSEELPGTETPAQSGLKGGVEEC